MSDGKIEKFLQTALELAQKGETGDRIIEASRTGRVATPHWDFDSSKDYLDSIREVAKRVLYRYWNEKRVPLEIGFGVQLVAAEINSLIDGGEEWRWGRPVLGSSFPITVRRRFNELADQKWYLEHRGKDTVPAAISLRQGRKSCYVPNPYFLPTEVKAEMESILAERLKGQLVKGR